MTMCIWMFLIMFAAVVGVTVGVDRVPHITVSVTMAVIDRDINAFFVSYTLEVIPTFTLTGILTEII